MTQQSAVEPATPSRRSLDWWQVLAAAVLALSLAATVIVWRVADDLEQKAAHERFVGQAERATARIKNRMRAYEQVLRGGVALFAAFDTVTRDNWRDYVAGLDLDAGYPGIQGVGFSQAIRPADLAAHVAQIRAEGFPEYEIRPAGERDEYTAIVFLEPFDERNRQAFGFDMFSEQTRRTAMERARDTGNAALSGRVELVQEITEDKQAGFLLYLPVYANGSMPDDVEGRREALVGYVYSPFRATNLMRGILQDDFPDISVDLFDGVAIAAGNALYEETAGSATPASASTFVDTDAFEIGGRQWTVTYRSQPASDGFSLATGALLVGIVISLLLFIVVWALGGTRQRALRLAQTMTAERESSEAKFHDLFSFAHDAIVLVGGDGAISDVNLQAETTFGYERDELIGQKIETLVPLASRKMHVDLRDRFIDQPVRRVMASGMRDLRGQRKDGTTFPAAISLTPLLSGSAMVIAAEVRDLTNEMAIEQQLRQAQKMEAVGQLTGGLAHDFNNHLSVIIGNLDLLQDSKAVEPASGELVSEALDAALRGADLSQRLLAFSRRQPLQPERIDLNAVVPKIGTLLRRTFTENIEIKLDLEPDTWPVIADPAQFEASLLNIANNARDAMPDGGILIIGTGNRHLDEDFTDQHPGLKPGGYALIEISDTGTGMPPTVVDQIFEPFFTTKDLGKGTGLGLSMVFGFMQQSGGHIHVYSEPGVGTTFRLFLPRAVEAGDAIETTIAAMPERGGGETILIVEDNAGLRRVVVRQLKELGYRLLQAEDGPSALRILEAESADLLFTDIVMPGGISGYELSHTALQRWPSMKVVLTSGFPDAKPNGNVGPPLNLRMLVKPYRKTDLASTLREVLDG